MKTFMRSVHSFIFIFAFNPSSQASDAKSVTFFEERIRPILAERCFECHGSEKQKGGLRLDSLAAMSKGGDTGPAVTPGDAAASLLLKAVSYEDPDLQMPPEKKGGKLSERVIADLTAWVNAGANWPKSTEATDAGPPAETHWSLKPLVKPPVPGSNQNPIDAFITAALKKEKLALSVETDRRTLIRRVSFDLTGLPPTPKEVEAFIADKDSKAYEKLVGRLLASPHYGERWARHWLDTIHFADSHGYEHDIGRENAWRFRDYVIAALNLDTPWPRFIREQLAADYFYPDESRLTAALGFLGAGTFDLSTFSTAPVTFDYLDRDDLVTQTMSAFVSTTANCARCHAHKFDPVSQEDYYALQAVFSGVLKGDVIYDEDPDIMRERRKWTALLTAADKKDATVLLAAENEPILRKWQAEHGKGVRWQPLVIETFLSTEGATLTNGAQGVIVSGGKRPEKDIYTVTAFSPLKNITALRLNVIAMESLPMGGPGRQDNGNLHLSEFEALVFDSGEQPRPVKFRRATADFNQADWGIERALDGDINTAWGIHPAVGKSHHAVFELAEKLTLKPKSKLTLLLKQLHGQGHLIGAFSLAATSDDPAHSAALPADIEAILAISPTDRSETQRVAVAAHALRSFAEAALAKLPPPVRVYAAAASVEIPSGDPPRQLRSLPGPKVVNLLHRGDFDKPRAVVEPGALSALAHLPSRFVLNNSKNEAERRAALADWLAHPDNVLTWRSVVNRVWHYHFGRGLCDTPSDFGRMGGTPSHPELIDWLAVWFRDDAKGSLKELHRLIVTSATYRQSSAQREDAASIDGDNRLLWRQNRLRLDADTFRDFTLAISGRLEPTMGGPAIQHFKQSKGPQLTPALDYATYDWNSPDAGRRSIYRFVWRGISDPFMEALDFPDLGLLSPVRGFSASSLQSLALFNNDFVLFQSAALATRIELEAKTPEAQINRAVQIVWLREPTASERVEFESFARLHGLAAFCRILLNSNEFLFVN